MAPRKPVKPPRRRHYTMLAERGSFVFSGSAIGVRRTRGYVLRAAPGSFIFEFASSDGEFIPAPVVDATGAASTGSLGAV